MGTFLDLCQSSLPTHCRSVQSGSLPPCLGTVLGVPPAQPGHQGNSFVSTAVPGPGTEIIQLLLSTCLVWTPCMSSVGFSTQI